MNKYKFDIVALSETWLKNNKTQLEYVQSDGYRSEYKNRDSKSGEGVGFYIKEHWRVLTFDTVLEKLMNRFRFSGLRFKIEVRTHWFL